MKKKLSMILTSLLLVISLVACSNDKKVDSNTNSRKEAEVLAKVAVLKGPTSMGMVEMMQEAKEDQKEKDNDKEKDDKDYEFNIVNSVDEIVPKIVNKDLDMAAVPSNVASVLYNKTKGNVDTLAINTLGILYIVENGNSVKNISDLKGKHIYSSGKGATPQYALDYILRGNGIDPEKDVKVEYKSEHTEVLSALMNDKNAIAVLPQPFVTVAQEKDKNLNVAIDFNKEWDKLNKDSKDKSKMITGVLVVRKDFADKYPEKVKDFMEDYKESIEFTNKNIDKAAKLIGQFNIVPEAVAKKAIPHCNITYIDGQEMKNNLSAYLKILYDANPKSIGGKMPGEDFYYIQKN